MEEAHFALDIICELGAFSRPNLTGSCLQVYKIASDAIAACQRGLPIELLWNTADAALGSRAEASKMTIADATLPGHDRVGIEAAAVSKRARQGAADRAVLGSLNGG